jgi:hypothetical protein
MTERHRELIKRLHVLKGYLPDGGHSATHPNRALDAIVDDAIAALEDTPQPYYWCPLCQANCRPESLDDLTARLRAPRP